MTGSRSALSARAIPNHANDRNRSIPLRQFSPLLETGASFYLLQTECRPEDEAFLSETPQIRDLRPATD